MRRTGLHLAGKLAAAAVLAVMLWWVGRRFGAEVLQYAVTIGISLAMTVQAVIVFRQIRLGMRSRRIRLRIEHGECPQCGYSLRGTPERCPECGLVQSVETLQQIIGDSK